MIKSKLEVLRGHKFAAVTAQKFDPLLLRLQWIKISRSPCTIFICPDLIFSDLFSFDKV